MAVRVPGALRVVPNRLLGQAGAEQREWGGVLLLLLLLLLVLDC